MTENTSEGDYLEKKIVPLGIIVGGGSGKVLAQVFHDFINQVVQTYVPDVVIYWYLPGHEYRFTSQGGASWDIVANTKDDEVYGSYELIKRRGTILAEDTRTASVTEAIQKLSKEESDRLTTYYQYLCKQGVEAVFRTSINAESLYELRQKLISYKGIILNKDDIDWTKGASLASSNGTRKVLLVRDQSQGFYANDDYQIENGGTEEERVSFGGHYSKKKIRQLVAFSKKRAHKRFNGGEYLFWASYKCHLFGNILSEWFKDIDPTIKVFQPDTGFNKLMDFLNNNDKDSKGSESNATNLVFLASNEVGDLLYEPFTEILKNTGQKIDLYSRSFFLGLSDEGSFVEYQTVYGSADDIAGADGKGFDLQCSDSGRLYPFATIRAASEIAAEKLNLPWLRAAVDKAVADTKLHILLHGDFANIQDTCDHIWNEVTGIHPS